MSRFHGPQRRGAMRGYREIARAEAEARQMSERERDHARASESIAALREWRRSPEGRAARRFQRNLERRLGAALGVSA